MKENLSPQQYKILKKLSVEDWKSTTEIFEDEIAEIMSRRWLLEKLDDFTGNRPGLVELRNGNPKKWKLSRKGKKALERHEETQIEYGDNVGYGEKIRLWEEYLAKKDVNIEEKATQLGRDVVSISYTKLEKFSPQLGDELEDNFGNTLNALEEALKETAMVEKPHLENLHIKLEDYYFSTEEDEDSIQVSQLRSKHIGKLVKVEGQAESVTKVQPEIVSAIFECQQCGERYEKEQDSTKVSSPYKCECGSRKFDIEEKKMQDSMMFRMKTKTAEGGKGEVRCIIRGAALEELHTLQKNIGKNVKVTGVLRERETKEKNRRYGFILEVNNVEYSSDNWELEPLSSQRKKELKKLRSKYEWSEWLEKLCGSFAPHILYRQPIKMTGLFILLGRNDIEPQNNNFNALIVGDPGTGKSDTFEWAEKEMPKMRMGDGQASTGVGLTATTIQDDLTGKWEAQAGLLPKMHNGFVAIDEFDKMDDGDYDDLLSIMEDQKFRLNKANVDQEVPADVGIAALANPELGSIDPYEPKIQQIPIPSDKDAILNRFAYVLFVEAGFEDQEKDRKVNQAVLLQGEPEENLQEERKVIESEFGVEEMREIIQYGQSIFPELTEEALHELDRFHRKHSEKMNDEDAGGKISNKRQLLGMKQVCRAFARMDFSETIEMRHVEEMKSFYQIIGERAAPEYDMEGEDLSAFIGSFPQSAESFNKNKRAKFKKLIRELGGDEEPVEVQKLVDKLSDRIDESEQYVEEVLDSMNSEDEAFEPKSGFIQLT